MECEENNGNHNGQGNGNGNNKGKKNGQNKGNNGNNNNNGESECRAVSNKVYVPLTVVTESGEPTEVLETGGEGVYGQIP